MIIKDFLQQLEKATDERFFMRRDRRGRWEVWTYYRDRETPVEKRDELDGARSYMVHLVQTADGSPREPEQRDIDTIRKNTYENTFGDKTVQEARAQIMDNYYAMQLKREQEASDRIDQVVEGKLRPQAEWLTKSKIVVAKEMPKTEYPLGFKRYSSVRHNM